MHVDIRRRVHVRLCMVTYGTVMSRRTLMQDTADADNILLTAVVKGTIVCECCHRNQHTLLQRRRQMFVNVRLICHVIWSASN